ncbi:type II CRISPR-associated endonuclease Cas1 [Magnetospirillum moscoviense]|uniref:CRISPR-associated endonuclease Cas1 n=1 Tax=Magnetospirillum moscoviense TaxID=1437059 RepID=A0A178N0B4_9PROT|nr:type II CRISPR-associated endonuclease Cas1 [Magnetospirillum moscoviense]OAN67036.1 subtype II CRISPR-associated endonuclease Cas1 [Magnetospirillum moscoviense]
MAWRGLHISRPARLSLADGQIAIEQEDGIVRLALEDLAWVVLDTPQASLTAALLSACMEAGVALITTDATHMPNGMALSFHAHHRQAQMAWRQIAVSAPFKKRCWQAIIQAKIAHQAAVLAGRDPDGSDTLAEMARHVGSGDPGNVEARVARFYWQHLFPDFRREAAADRRNAMLNYGYAILRSALARSLVASGLLPAFGLHHASATNPFNLADDLIEPFRPLVDRLVVGLATPPWDRPLTIDDRRALAGVLLESTCIDGDAVTALVACERVAASLVRAIDTKSPDALALPQAPP